MPRVKASQVVALARTQIGVEATNVKRCKYNDWFYGVNVSGSGYDWCEVWIQWLFDQLNASDMIYIKTANCGAQGQAFQKRGKLVTKDYKFGDIMFFHWDNEKSNWVSGCYSLDHVGIVEKVNSNGSYTTIEGNTGGGNGKVMRRTRWPSEISCACRPDYLPESPSTQKPAIITVEIRMQRICRTNTSNRTGQVQTVQRILNELRNGDGYRGKDGKKLEVDGVFGVNTEYAVMAYQKAHGLTVDGVVGEQTWNALLCSVPQSAL